MGGLGDCSVLTGSSLPSDYLPNMDGLFPKSPVTAVPLKSVGSCLGSGMGELSWAVGKPLPSVSGHLRACDPCGFGFWPHRIATECATVPQLRDNLGKG